MLILMGHKGSKIIYPGQVKHWKLLHEPQSFLFYFSVTKILASNDKLQWQVTPIKNQLILLLKVQKKKKKGEKCQLKVSVVYNIM